MKKYIYWAIIAILVIARIFAAGHIIGYANDILGCFHFWAKNIQQRGLAFAYISNDFGVDYPPVYLYFLWGLGAFINFSTSWWNNNISVIIMKLPALLADFTLAYMAYKITRDSCKNAKQKTHLPFISAILILVCPTMLINSAYWGQIDSIFCLFLLLSFYYGIKKKYVPCAVWYIITLLTKPQAAIFAPIVIIFAVEALINKKYKEFGIAIMSCLVLLFGICYFVSPQNGLNIWWVKDRLFSTMSQYPYASMNANNLYYLMGLNYAREKYVTHINWSLIKFLVPTVATLFAWIFWIFSKTDRQTKTFIIASIIMLMVYNFMPEMHERYSYPAVIFIFFTFCSCLKFRILPVWLIATIASTLNHYWVLVPNIWYESNWKWESIYNNSNLWAIMFLLAFAAMLILSLTLKERQHAKKA